MTEISGDFRETLQKLKMVLTRFLSSLHNGYMKPELDSEFTPSSSDPVPTHICSFPRTSLATNLSLWLCDAFIFDLLQNGSCNLQPISRGIAWPHINLDSKDPAMEWFVFNTDVWRMFDVSHFPQPKVW